MNEIHRILLGQMILDKDVYFLANLPPDAFPEGTARMVYRVVRKRLESGDGVDLQLLARDLPEMSAAVIAGITTGVPSSANWQHYAREVRRAWVTKQLQWVAANIMETAGEDDALERAYERLATIGDANGAETHLARAMVHEYIKVVEDRYKLGGKLPGISTGFERLDALTLGFRSRALYYVGARPADGKTALLLCFAATICKAGRAVGIISMESSRKELMNRIFANVGNINGRDLMSGLLKPSQFVDITTTAEKIYDWRLTVCDREHMTLPAIMAKGREMVKTHGAEVLLIDYTQLVDQVDRAQNFRLHMNEVSKGFKAMARELDVAVVAAAQLGRDAENRRPYLSDFKESGQLEQDADVALLIWHEDDKSHILVEKNRDGAQGDVMVHFHRDKLRFAPAVPDR